MSSRTYETHSGDVDNVVRDVRAADLSDAGIAWSRSARRDLVLMVLATRRRPRPRRYCRA